MTVTEHAEGRALASVPRQAPGVEALALLSDQAFEQKLTALKRGRERIERIQRELMTPEEDFGVIPGTNSKPTLLKPGAEKLCEVYGLRAGFVESTEFGDGLTAPHLRVRMKCELHLGTLDGPVVAEGYGAANSWERKHRYRRGERSCPDCGQEGTVIRGKQEYGGGWLCFAKKGGCGAKFAVNDPAIAEQAVGDVQNEDPYDIENTLLKMAEKRAFIDATLRATATSGLFTQDLEDSPIYEPPARGKAAAREPGQDDEPVFDAQGHPLPPEAERVAAAGAEPNPVFDPDARREPPRKPAPPSRGGRQQPGGGTAPCPHCGKPAKPSQFPKPGKTHYCYGCKHPFAPEDAA